MHNKKGVLFTIIAIVIAAFLSLIFSSRIETAPDYRMDLVETRINMLYDYVNSFYDFAGEASTLAGYGAIYGIATNISMSHEYDPLFNQHFNSCFLTGNLTSSQACPGMTTKHLPYYLDQFTAQAKKNLKISSNYSIDISSIYVDQVTDPFAVDIFFNISLNVSDAFVNMTTLRNIHVIVPIDNIPDPLFSANNYSRLINRSSLNKAESSWNSTDLESLYNNHQYRAYSNALSFINRIKGNFTTSRMGIESIVNQSNVTIGLIDIDVDIDISMIDYLFWNRTGFDCSGKELVRINSTLLSTIGLTDPKGLQIDDVHRLSFNIASSNAYILSWCP